jgi:hypothetical protein
MLCFCGRILGYVSIVKMSTNNARLMVMRKSVLYTIIYESILSIGLKGEYFSPIFELTLDNDLFEQTLQSDCRTAVYWV